MASRFKALFAQRKMALGWCSNVNNVRTNGLQHLFQVGKTFRNAQALPELFGHQQFPIANSHDRAVRNPVDGPHMLISDLAAADYGDAERSREISGHRSE